MGNKAAFSSKFDHTTIFIHSETTIWLTRLWDMECGLHGTNAGPANTQGLCVLDAPRRRYEGDDFRLVEFHLEANSMQLCWQVGDTGILWRSSWRVHLKTGVWSRRDRLENTTPSPIELRRCLMRIPFAPGRYEIYNQASHWARENQGYWNHFFASRLTFRSHSGRTTQIATPYLFVRESGAHHGVAFHILPRGNWAIHIDRTSTTRDELSPFNVIELGLSEQTLRLTLTPGHAFDLPEILIQDIPSDRPEAGSANLHRYVLENNLTGYRTAPIVYNTWFDDFDNLSTDRLHAQLRIAREIGCEVFTVDAGWYGQGEGGWHRLVGDWREKVDTAFHGEMARFAEDVRAAGLGYGLWVEPERYGPEAPIVQAHPDWFLPGVGGFLYPDLSQPAAYRYVFTELSRLLETYQLAWMKVDFNFELGYSDDEFSGYFEYWYQLLDELRAKYPNTFFEGCASGGMRLDLNTLSHFDGHFLSDTVNPFDMLRITQGSLLRLPIGRITKWAVVRAHNNEIFTPGGASWDNAMLMDVDFICRAALPGMFGISGDLQNLPEQARARLKHHITFYKKWRRFMYDATCHVLTPISSLDDRSEWIAFQLENLSQPGLFVLFIYRLMSGVASKSFRLKSLEPSQSYTVASIDAPDSLDIISGLDLHRSGLQVDLPRPNSAAVLIVRATTSREQLPHS